MKKLVLFGAGKIGRSFIAQLFSRAGYEIVFIDTDKKLVNLLNKHKTYNIFVKDKTKSAVVINKIRAIHISQKNKILNEIATASIAAVSVGHRGLHSFFPVYAKAIEYRWKKVCSPLDLIICENIRDGKKRFSDKLVKLLPDNFPFDEQLGLIETSIGKMVPIMNKSDLEKDPLQLFAEAHNSLPIDAIDFKNPIPKVEGLVPVENIQAWVERKLLIHNLGHATAAYLGHLEKPGEKLLWKVLANQKVLTETRETMLQSAYLLLQKYPNEFSFPELGNHVDNLLERFQNKSLGDSIFRVGCDLYRKLGKEDRLAGAIHLALEMKMPYDKILKALVAGFHFSATDENDNLFPLDEKFIVALNENGFPQHFQKVTGLKLPHLLKQAINLDYTIAKNANLLP